MYREVPKRNTPVQGGGLLDFRVRQAVKKVATLPPKKGPVPPGSRPKKS